MKNADEAKFNDYRSKEIKHGRAAMMACLGFLVQPQLAPVLTGKADTGCQALESYPTNAGFACLVLVTGLFELNLFSPDKETEPGNFGDPWEAVGVFGAYNETWRLYELNNGRLAMVGAIGAIVAGFVTGENAYGQWQNSKDAAIAFIRLTLPFAP